MRPNFVFTLADDLGYADLGCYGGRSSCSPELDAMAAEGLRFTDRYSNSPVCSPTCFARMTGRFQYRLRGGNDEPIASRHRDHPELGLPPARAWPLSRSRADGGDPCLLLPGRRLSVARGMEAGPLVLLAVVTTGAAYLIGIRRLKLSGQSFGRAVLRMLELVGLTLVFFVINVAVGLAVVLAIRGPSAGFVSVYLLNDLSLVALSALPGTVFGCRWWERRG
jgi:hypothetical protein